MESDRQLLSGVVEEVMNPLEGVKLTPMGLAISDFAFRDGLKFGLDDKQAFEVAMDLIGQWDGSETLEQIYKRTRQWPDTISPS